MSCIFCGIAKKEIPAMIVHETASLIAFDDIAPQAPVHVVVIPKAHLRELEELKDNGDVFSVMTSIAREKGLAQKGFRIVVNKGSEAGQTVEHIHFHLLGGRKFKWPPG